MSAGFVAGERFTPPRSGEDGVVGEERNGAAAAERLREHVLRTEQQESALAAADLSKMEGTVPELSAASRDGDSSRGADLERVLERVHANQEAAEREDRQFALAAGVRLGRGGEAEMVDMSGSPREILREEAAEQARLVAEGRRLSRALADVAQQSRHSERTRAAAQRLAAKALREGGGGGEGTGSAGGEGERSRGWGELGALVGELTRQNDRDQRV